MSKHIWNLKSIVYIILGIISIFSFAKRTFAADYSPTPDYNMGSTFDVYASGIASNKDNFSKDYVYFRSGQNEYKLIIFDDPPAVSASTAAGAGTVYTFTSGNYGGSYGYTTNQDDDIFVDVTDRFYYSNLPLPAIDSFDERGVMFFVQACLFAVLVPFFYTLGRDLFSVLREHSNDSSGSH